MDGMGPGRGAGNGVDEGQGAGHLLGQAGAGRTGWAA